jgi:ribonuclease Z
MSMGFHQSQQFVKTCGILRLLTKHQRQFSYLKRNSTDVVTACLRRPHKSESVIQFCRWKMSAPPLAVPAMSEPQPKEDLMPREVQQYNVGAADGWLNIGQYSVFAWSVSGVESCIVIRCEDLQLAFDMGVAVAESVRVPNVFITHGHVDHVGAITSHVAKRELTGMKPARYFAPPHLIQPIYTILRAHFEMAQTLDLLRGVNIHPIVEGDVVRLSSRYFVKTFPTIHRIPSQGYIVYKEEKTLKKEYRGKDGFEVAALHRQGIDIHDVTVSPEIAYCGDTVFDIFLNPPTPDLLKVKLLITEATYLDDHIGKNMIQKAKGFGHTHLMEIAQNAELFKDVGHIVLVHFSNKYSPKYIHDCINDKLPPRLREKVTPAVVAKATVATTYS